jgi:hypothetical protein
MSETAAEDTGAGTVSGMAVETSPTDATTQATVTVDGRLCAAAPSLTSTVPAGAAEQE